MDTSPVAILSGHREYIQMCLSGCVLKTWISSGYEVYDRLSPSFAKYLETLEAVHEARFFHNVAQALGNKLRDG